MTLALILSFIAGFADIFGGFLSVGKKVQQKTLSYFIAISAGFILAVTLLDIYPEVIKDSDNGPLLILIGFILIFVTENLFAVHAHEGHGEHDHTIFGDQYSEETLLKRHSVLAAFIGLLVHTFFDGAAIAARLLASPIGGILVFLAVLSHKVPEGFAMASIFQAGGTRRLRAFLGAASLGLATVIGAAAVYLTGRPDFSLIFLGLAGGSFTYITTSELIPYITGTKDKKGIFFFLIGVVLFYLTSQLLALFGL
jgi:zinc transporter ZupT